MENRVSLYAADWRRDIVILERAIITQICASLSLQKVNLHITNRTNTTVFVRSSGHYLSFCKDLTADTICFKTEAPLLPGSNYRTNKVDFCCGN